MRPVTAQHKQSVSPQARIGIGAMQKQQQQQQQQRQGLLTRPPNTGTKEPEAKPAFWADICAVARPSS